MYKKGLKEGEEKGRMQEKLMIAKNLKAQGMPLNLIAEMTGLDQQILAELK